MDFWDILRLISGPLIGALIGYLTNWLAVKMLFRPLHPKKLGKWTLPFTPGVIPRRKDALAASMGKVVEEQLFTLEDLGATVASERVERLVADRVVEGFHQWTADRNLSEVLEQVLGEERYVDGREKVFETALNAICRNVEEMQLGTLVGAEVKNYVDGFVANNALIGWVLTKERVARIAEQFSERLEEFLSENLELMVAPRLAGEIEKLELLPMEQLSIPEDLVRDLVHKVFTAFVTDCLPQILKAINIGATVEQKISAMDARDLEKMVLSVMKKELSAVVNLGAVLGFLIGILNIFI